MSAKDSPHRLRANRAKLRMFRRPKRVDVARRRLVIAEGLSEVGGRVVWSSPKTHRTRSVPVPRSLISGLIDLCAGIAPDDPVFTSHKGDRSV